MWISFFYFTVPLGLIIGVAITKAFNDLINSQVGYKWAFATQTILMIALVAIPMIFFPDYYYDKPREEPEQV